ncbi:ATP-grasp fold amidoligase family protein [Ilyobacter polytropus]|uniref:Glycosyltransferase n=1 Tax=Ilyobacter polytropus (strain ATCC 51220 / DSM 2926 / LMG 16218 / CuHBu1) TaxID=572544 RepID=E3HB29_ILYPC|nr:ATP-grasp fold amidoligase family protein [Ilyobacter polytropus]ADO82178.1 glycosyltransferase [Ilyobacter polytropus DSM 2926]
MLKKKIKLILRKNLSDEIFIKISGLYHLGYLMNLKKPKTFNEKIQYRKLYDKNPLYSLCSDKYRAREYVKEKIGEDYLIPLHLVTKKLTEKQWNNLPNKFVAKANHNSGPVQIVKDKSKTYYENVAKELHRQLNEKFGILTIEYYYEEIKPLIIIEDLLMTKKGLVDDYKFHCFNSKGEFKCIFMYDYGKENDMKDYPRQMFDENFNKLPFELSRRDDGKELEKPKNFDKMISLAKKLSKDFDYVRVDFFEVDDNIYFNELTFCHACGFQSFNPREWDYKLGSYWDQKINNDN